MTVMMMIMSWQASPKGANSNIWLRLVPDRLWPWWWQCWPVMMVMMSRRGGWRRYLAGSMAFIIIVSMPPSSAPLWANKVPGSGQYWTDDDMCKTGLEYFLGQFVLVTVHVYLWISTKTDISESDVCHSHNPEEGSKDMAWVRAW